VTVAPARRPRRLGLVLLDTAFPRPPGDVGHPATFAPLDVRRRVVAGASPARIVGTRDPAWLAPFAAAVRSLADEGCDAVVTSCGFLARHQGALAAAAPVPVWTSSLLLVPGLDRALGPGRRAGVLTVDAASLGAPELEGAGARADTPVSGLAPGSAFRGTLLGNAASLDAAEAERATVDAALRLVRAHPEVGAIVLECTNLPPHAAAVRAATGLPVFDIVTLVRERLPATEEAHA
jgi:hypothetical protein